MKYLLLALVLGGLAQWPAGVARADEVAQRRAADQHEIDEMLRRVRPLEMAQPEKAVAGYRTFLQAHPDLDPKPALELFSTIIDFCCARLKQTDVALKMCDWAEERYGEDPIGKRMLVRTLGDRAHALVAAGRAPEAQALIEKEWDRLLSGYGAGTICHAVRQYCLALEAQGKRDDAIGALRKALAASPDCLQEDLQGSEPGWMYARIVDDLVAQGQYDEALRWAKLDWITAPRESCRPRTGRATLLLQRVWRLKEGSSRAAGAFEDAVQDGSKPNPLAGVKLPEIDVPAFRARADRPDADPIDRPGHLHALVVSGRMAEAMALARRWFVAEPDEPPVEYVHQVLKAGFLNLDVLDALQRYRETGRGPNPLEEFSRRFPPSDEDDEAGSAGKAEAASKASPETPADGSVVLSHVRDAADGSVAGTGLAVLFQRPEKAHTVARVRLFAAGSGTPTARKETFSLCLLDAKMQKLVVVACRSAAIGAGEPRWYDFDVPPTEVTGEFAVALEFPPEADRAVYVGFQRAAGETHSLLGTPQRGYHKMAEGIEWMVRVVLSERPQRDQGESHEGR